MFSLFQEAANSSKETPRRDNDHGVQILHCQTLDEVYGND